jgi:hypothetical protein
MAEWRLYNPSPVARNVGDCAVRAVAKALGIDWEAAYATLSFSGYQMADMPSSNSVISAVLRKNGFYRHIIPNHCPECFTVEEFVDEHPDGLYVIGTGNHVVTAEDGIVYDSWDSRREIPIYYWSREEAD